MAEPELERYYGRDEEKDRLASGVGRVEFLRTIEVIGRHLPPPGAVIADIGGGPGHYTDWLIEHGYTVIHRDPIPLHVDHVSRRHGSAVDAAVGDARSLDLGSASVGAVLLLGPLYHLNERSDRLKALAEANRIVQPNGPVFAAAISRWAPRLHGMLVDRVHLKYPVINQLIDEMERTGQMPPLHDSSFTGYAHTVEQLADEVQDAGLEMESLVSVEGLSFALGDLDQRLEDPDELTLLLGVLRTVEKVPELRGLGPHLLVTARRPA